MESHLRSLGIDVTNNKRRRTSLDSDTALPAAKELRADRVCSSPSARSWSHGRPSLILVDSLLGCKKASQDLSQQKLLAVDFEGVRLSRFGRLCLIQIATRSMVYIFDIISIGPSVFSDGGLARLLNRKDTVKVFHDCREDSSAIFHQFGVKLQGVFDTQCCFRVLSRHRDESLSVPNIGLNALLQRYLGVSHQLKSDIGSRMNRDCELWLRRPLTDQLIEYAQLDVSLLLPLFDALKGELTETGVATETVMRESARYAQYAMLNQHISDPSELCVGMLLEGLVNHTTAAAVHIKLGVCKEGVIYRSKNMTEAKPLHQLCIGQLVTVRIRSITVTDGLPRISLSLHHVGRPPYAPSLHQHCYS
eukprot:GILK01007836.1.p1 GENE.GILK01007836.1~~GILK01007836.1.p1  ORF type:complete len:363 (+),score=41.71 GILK01007836.1:43-1131(+)